MNTDNRIRMAEAMGWKEHHGIGDYPRTWRLQGPGLAWTERKLDELPDPENDANDDYAVLEWMRRSDDDGCWTGPNADDFIRLINNGHSEDYKIGDYARAALKVLK